MLSPPKARIDAKRRRGLGTGPRAGVGNEFPIVPNREAMKKSNQGAKRALTVVLCVTLFDLRFIRNKGWLAEF